jgi:hypothetical protein
MVRLYGVYIHKTNQSIYENIDMFTKTLIYYKNIIPVFLPIISYLYACAHMIIHVQGGHCCVDVCYLLLFEHIHALSLFKSQSTKCDQHKTKPKTHTGHTDIHNTRTEHKIIHKYVPTLYAHKSFLPVCCSHTVIHVH